MTKRRGRHLARVLLMLALLLVPVACTEGETQGSEQEAEPAPQFTGRMLTTGGLRDPAMQVHDLAADTTERVRLPGDPRVVDAFWNESGDAAYVLAEAEETGLILEIGSDGRARRLGEALPGHANTADLGGSLLLAPVCRRTDPSILVMDVEGPLKWKKVASGCSGALSPDGQEVVYSPDARTLWTIAASGRGRTRKFADLEELTGVEPDDVPLARVENIDWGDGGIAIEVSIADRLLAVVAGEDGSLEAIAGDPGVNELELTWQPDGDQLAVVTFSSAFNDAEAVLRMIDADQQEGQVVAIDPSRFFNMTWSPNGDYLVVTTSDGRWLFADAEGNWLKSEHIVAAGTLDWAP
ncbi:MAG: hypothetical protein GEU68_03055 [Actinobacteria bacterium]|nr:hypothetical protein [Actinomycetota bacterium]